MSNFKHLILVTIFLSLPFNSYSKEIKNRQDLKVAESVSFVVVFKENFWELRDIGYRVKLYDRYIFFEQHKYDDMHNYDNRLDKSKEYKVSGIVFYMAYGLYHVLVDKIEPISEN